MTRTADGEICVETLAGQFALLRPQFSILLECLSTRPETIVKLQRRMKAVTGTNKIANANREPNFKPGSYRPARHARRSNGNTFPETCTSAVCDQCRGGEASSPADRRR